ncbi:MAG: FlgO family outer membrane protein [Chromatiales bacterium]|nr:FlgO family outer membrane protein [Chromatiales bacterium]
MDINNLEMSSGLGRVIGEQIGSKFAQQGFTVDRDQDAQQHFRQAEGAGEFALSRSVREISQSHNAAAVIAGTYAVARQSVFVQARLIRATDNLDAGILRLRAAAMARTPRRCWPRNSPTRASFRRAWSVS